MAPIQRFPDRGIILAARPGKTILALVAGDADPEIRLGATLSGPFPMKRLATTRFRRLVATDGAPVAGPLKAQKVFVVAGFGDLAAFMAPALARCLTGQSSEDERSWFLAHDPSRSGDDLIEFAA
jgi:hypothetical protein